jgi:signal transduction histidine kinase
MGPPPHNERMTRDQWTRRRELERQLHDGPALRIAALTLHLGLLARKAGELGPDIEVLQGQLHLVQQELRAIADRIYPALLQEAGLGPALRELAGRAAVPVRIDVPDGRFDPAVEGIAYFAVLDVLEGLGPATRTVDVTVHRTGDGLALDLGDGETGEGGGLDSDRGSGMGTIRVRIPCE